MLTASDLHAQSDVKKIENLLQQYTEYKQFNGSALIAKKGKVIYKGGFGYANMEWDVQNASDTKHRLGSITKQFTGMLIMQLVEQGKLDVQKPISTYLPDYPKKSGDIITTHHLLTHTSGIPNYTSFPDFFSTKSRDPKTPDEFIEIFKDLPLEFEPGEKFNYSNSAYFLLGVIIEKVSGKSYESNLHELILEPLKMHDTGYDHHNTILKNRATGYDQNGNNFRNSNYLDMSLPYAAGSMYASAEDLYKWDRALYGNELLSKENMETYFAPYIKAFGNLDYAYGFAVGEMKIGDSDISTEVTTHGGGINGFNTIILRDIREEHLIVLLNNTGGKPLNEISQKIMAILYKQPYELPKKDYTMAIAEKYTDQNKSFSVSDLQSLANTNSYQLSEDTINGFGYELLNANQIANAITIFEFNTQKYPESFNTFDSLGEAYMMNGENEKAILNYEKSVKMNPDNKNGVDMLKKLGADISQFEKEIIIPENVLESYVGKYELMPNFILTITKKESQLFIQATGQGISEIYASSETKFYSKIVNAQITFNINQEGIVESLTLHQGGNHNAKKIE
ncbi:hypothetical protein KH5_07770 [Urechidicola sp. KH5]